MPHTSLHSYCCLSEHNWNSSRIFSLAWQFIPPARGPTWQYMQNWRMNANWNPEKRKHQKKIFKYYFTWNYLLVDSLTYKNYLNVVFYDYKMYTMTYGIIIDILTQFDILIRKNILLPIAGTITWLQFLTTPFWLTYLIAYKLPKWMFLHRI